jgi:hypothetical protein
MDGVKVPRGGKVDTATKPAPSGYRWCPKRKGYHAHVEEAAHHEAATADCAPEAMLRRLEALERAIAALAPGGGS